MYFGNDAGHVAQLHGGEAGELGLDRVAAGWHVGDQIFALLVGHGDELASSLLIGGRDAALTPVALA